MDSIRYLKQAKNNGHKEAIAEYDKHHKQFLKVFQAIRQLKEKASAGNKDAKQALAKINAEIDSKICREIFNAMLSEFGFTSSAQSSPSSRKPAKKR